MFEAVMRIRCTEGTHTLLHPFLLIFLVHLSLSFPPTYLIPLSHHWYTYLPHPSLSPLVYLYLPHPSLSPLVYPTYLIPLSHHWFTYLPHSSLSPLIYLLVPILLVHVNRPSLSGSSLPSPPPTGASLTQPPTGSSYPHPPPNNSSVNTPLTQSSFPPPPTSLDKTQYPKLNPYYHKFSLLSCSCSYL